MGVDLAALEREVQELSIRLEHLELVCKGLVAALRAKKRSERQQPIALPPAATPRLTAALKKEN